MSASMRISLQTAIRDTEDGNPTDAPEIDLAALTSLSKNEGKKKKKKKRKKSAADKELEKLEKQSEDLRSNTEEFRNFILKFEQWLNRPRIKNRVLKFFQQADPENDGTVSYNEFKAGLLDLNSPCNRVEVHTLATILDFEKTKRVHYILLQNGLQVARAHEETYELEVIRPNLPLTDSNYKRCSKCKMWEGNGEKYYTNHPRYILVELRLAPFAKTAHPSHVTALVQSHVTLAYLTKVIVDQTDLLTTRIFFYNSQETKNELPLSKRLEDDYIGGTQDNPTKVILYYDYNSEFFDCPLLMSDYFIGLKERGRSRTGQADPSANKAMT